MTQVAIVVLNYNGQHFLEKFLPALIRNSQPYEVIVADNASTDDSLLLMQEQFPTCRVVEIETNQGFAGGYNEALRRIEAEYYVLINSDVEVPPGWCQPLIDFLQAQADYACCQPKILSYTDKSKFEYAGAAGGFLDFLGYPFCRGRIFDHLETDNGQYNEVAEIFWCSGACMAIKAQLFHEAGGFDGDFFAHMEEIDLCWRLQLLGYKSAYIPHSAVYHVGGGTLSRNNPKKTYLNFRNCLSLILKNMPLLQLVWILPVRLTLDILAATVFWKSNSYAHFRAVGGAIRDFLKQSARTFRKRQAITRLRAVRLVPRSVVFSYFIRGRRTYNQIFGNR